jgi:hypothetical protein
LYSLGRDAGLETEAVVSGLEDPALIGALDRDLSNSSR